MFLTLTLECFECISLHEGPILLIYDTLPSDIWWSFLITVSKQISGSYSDPIIVLSSVYILMWTKKRHVDAFQWPFLYLFPIILMLLLFNFLHANILGLFTNLKKKNPVCIFVNVVQLVNKPHTNCFLQEWKRQMELKYM